MKVELYVLVDSDSKIYYTGSNVDQLKNYADSMGYDDFKIVKLTGEVPQGELNV